MVVRDSLLLMLRLIPIRSMLLIGMMRRGKLLRRNFGFDICLLATQSWPVTYSDAIESRVTALAGVERRT